VIRIELVLPAVDPGVVAAAVAPAPPGAVALAALSGRATSPLDVAAVVVSALFRSPLPHAVNATSVAHAVAAVISCHLLSILPASFCEAMGPPPPSCERKGAGSASKERAANRGGNRKGRSKTGPNELICPNFNRWDSKTVAQSTLSLIAFA
jgi:hypothetical protein